MAAEQLPPVRLRLRQLVDYLAEFIAACEQKSRETQRIYHRALQEFLTFFVRDGRFLFRVRDVERYRRYLVRIRQLKPASVATYMTALRRFCQYLVERGVLQRNPARRVPGARRPQQHSRMFLTVEELRKLLESIETNTLQGLRDRALVLMMLGCACSEHELARATVGDIRRRGRLRFIYVQGKGKQAKDEPVPIPPKVWEALEAYLKARGATDPDEPLFLSHSPRSRGRGLSVRGIRETVNERLTAAGVKRGRHLRLTPFSLRHTAGLLMAESGASVEELMQRMRLRWRPTALLYYRQKGRLGSSAAPELQELVRLHR
jgi:integrase/recombinase XerC